MRDVTNEIKTALQNEAANVPVKTLPFNPALFTSPAQYVGVMGGNYLSFYQIMNHGMAWDIKEEGPWNNTIGTEYPGMHTEVIFDGNIMTPHMLGNFTYGYLGYEYGIPLSALLFGSYHAAGYPTSGGDLQNELEDWPYIQMGYVYAHNGGF